MQIERSEQQFANAFAAILRSFEPESNDRDWRDAQQEKEAAQMISTRQLTTMSEERLND
jgi:hypothetical protein